MILYTIKCWPDLDCRDVAMKRKANVVLCIAAIGLLIFQGFVLFIAKPKGYELIHDGVFYVINYVIIVIFIFLRVKNPYLKWIQRMMGLIFFVSNTVFFYYIGDINLVVSKSKDRQHEIILKEYKKMKYETAILQRRGLLFGKKTATLKGSSAYKTIEKNTYNVNWVGGDIAVVTYKTSDHGPLQQIFKSFRVYDDHTGFFYVGVSLTGKWVEQDNPQNYFIYDRGEMVYAKDGRLYYYSDREDTEQLGIYAVKINGDDKRPSFTVVLNSDSHIGSDDLIKDGGTITICPVTLEKSDYKVYSKK